MGTKMANLDLLIGIFVSNFIALVDGGNFCYYGYNTNTHYVYGFYYCYESCCGYYSNRYCCSNNTATIAGAIIGGIICLAVIIAMVACCIMASKAKRAQRGGNVISPTNINVVQYSHHRPQQLHGAFPAPPPYIESDPAYPPGVSNPSSSNNTRFGAFSPPPKYSEPPPVYS